MTVNMGPGPSTAHNPRCLARDFSPWLATRTINSTVVSWTLSADSFSLFDRRIQGLGLGVDGMTSHAGGHLSVGGDIGDVSCKKTNPHSRIFVNLFLEGNLAANGVSPDGQHVLVSR